MAAQKKAAGRRPQEEHQQPENTTPGGSSQGSEALDPTVTPEGKRPPREPMTAEALDRVIKSLPKELRPSHKETLLFGSCISEPIIKESGYFSVSSSDIIKFGFPESHGPALAMPYHNREGRIVQVDLRFDKPIPDPEKAGRSLRYLSPWGLPKVCDWQGPFPPSEIPIFLVEGRKKADALRSWGLYAIALPGIWALGLRAKEARKDVEGVEWKGLEVVVVFDTETKPKTKGAVEKARAFTCEYLVSLGAIPKIVKLPYIEDSQGKMGVDDWIRAGGTKEQLFDLIEDPEPEWRSRLVLTDTGNIRVNTFNLGLIIAHDPSFDQVRQTRFNDLTKRLELPDGIPIDMPKLTELAGDIEGSYRTSLIQIDTLQRVLELAGVQRSYHPIKAWLEAIPAWDKAPKIERLFPAYYGADDTPYTRSIGRNLLIASIARILLPGCKHDHCIVLEGPQGIGKSSSIPALYGQEWSTTSRADIASKDFVSGIIGFWAVELSELSSLRKSQIETIKAVLSATEDDIRLPYRRDTKRYPRQAVFIATTNEDAYLKDGTGNRRFWPVRCKRIDLEGLRRDREQLFAEALQRFRNGERWWEVPQDEARKIQEERLEIDSWEELIAPWLLNRWEATTSEILSDCLAIEKGRHDRASMIRVGSILKRLKWDRKRVRTSSGREWRYVPKSEMGTDGDNLGPPNTGADCPNVPIKNSLHFKEENKGYTHTHDTHMCIGSKSLDFNGTMGPANTGAVGQVVPILGPSKLGTTLPTSEVDL